MEVLWKAISGIINHQISSSIQFHDALHGFCAGRGTGTTTIEAKLLRKIISMKEMVLHSIFPDLKRPTMPWTGTPVWISWRDMY